MTTCRILWALVAVIAMRHAAVAGPFVDRVARNYALVIGVDKVTKNQPSDIPMLNYAAADANSVADELARTGRYEVNVLINEDADRDNIIQHIQQIARDAREIDTFVLFFAGHGVKSPITERQTLWVTYGTTLGTIEMKGMRLTHVLEYVAEIRARQKLIILDHCFSGAIAASVTVLVPAGPPSVAAGRGSPPTLTFQPRNLDPENDVPETLTLPATVGSWSGVYAAAWTLAYEGLNGHGVFTDVILKVLGTDRQEGFLESDDLHNDVCKWTEQEPTGPTPPQQGFCWQHTARSNWIVVDLSGTPQQIEQTAGRYLNHVESLYLANPDEMVSAKQHCEDAVKGWKTALLQQRKPNPRDLQIVGLLSRLVSDVRAGLDRDARAKALREFLTDLGLPL